ncbi:MAG: hypothetical protein IM535_09625 [Pseudanabaena sp. M38BS1SP1A06MG]|nr:hypothetical protein [Pseudanabaena sp. M34BS1SP1A06MG]MCA6592355.1 hypothetical protein [Pseudanabaena sp. M38BS1SP1A06MG]
MVLSSFLVLAWFRQSNYSQTYFQYTFSLVSSDAFYLRKVSEDVAIAAIKKVRFNVASGYLTLKIQE